MEAHLSLPHWPSVRCSGLAPLDGRVLAYVFACWDSSSSGTEGEKELCTRGCEVIARTDGVVDPGTSVEDCLRFVENVPILDREANVQVRVLSVVQVQNVARE